MVIDDEKNLAQLLQRILPAKGYRVSSFTDCQDAMRSFMAAPTDYDLIITDLNMPKVLGVDLAKACHAIRPELPIILYTGFSEKMESKQARAAGIRELLQKPVDREQLLVLVRTILDGEATFNRV